MLKTNQLLSINDLESLKLSFKKDINSNRQFHRIENVFDLIKLLFKRNCINQPDSLVLLTIIEKFTNSNDKIILTNYVKDLLGINANNQQLQQQNNVNLYQIQRNQDVQATQEYYNKETNYKLKHIDDDDDSNTIIEQSLTESITTSKQINEEIPSGQQKNNSQQPATTKNTMNSNELLMIENFNRNKNEIYKLLSLEIGKKWKQFGRELLNSKHRESVLESIEETNRFNLNERILKVLYACDQEYIMNGNNELEKKQKLFEALREIRRIDLVKNIDKILMK